MIYASKNVTHHALTKIKKRKIRHLMDRSFFTSELATTDKDIATAIQAEYERQRDQIELIASENIVSKAVMQAQGSVLTNKYAEGYPGKRYYGGCECVDIAENLAIERLCKIFGAKYANVQVHSGSQANQAVFAAVVKPGDCVLGMGLNFGGHLTHGSKVNLSGKWFDAHSYELDKETEQIDYDAVEKQAMEIKPKLIIAGASAYSRVIDFERFAQIAKKVGAYLLVDMAHIAGLVAAGEHPNPMKYADFVTSTTHKTMRGPRGGFILTNDEDLAKKVNSAVFPGLQGGPLMHVIAAKAVAFGEALQAPFKTYIKQVVKNATVMADTLTKAGIRVVSGGTDNHLVLLDLRDIGVTGKAAEKALERAGLTCNKNSVPYDEASPFVTSGIRLGSPAATSRGFKEAEFEEIATWIHQILQATAQNEEGDAALENEIHAKVKEMCARFPIYDEAL